MNNYTTHLRLFQLTGKSARIVYDRSMNPSIFKVVDIRGVYPTDLNESGAAKIAGACAKLFKPGKVVIAHDIRHGSLELAKVAMESIVKASGAKHEVIFVGLSTTPMFYFLVNELKASGGCMITASHNPKEYTGFKIVREQAEAVSGLTIREIISTL